MSNFLFVPETRYLAVTAELKQERRARGLKVRDLAQAAGISKAMMSYIENGRHPASVEVVRAIITLFKSVPRKS